MGPCEVPTLPGSGAGRGGVSHRRRSNCSRDESGAAQPPPSLIVPKRRRRGTLSSTQSAFDRVVALVLPAAACSSPSAAAERSPPTLPHSAEQPRPSPAPSSAPEAGPAAARIQLDLHATGYSMYDGAGPYSKQDSVSLDELLLPPPPVPTSRGASTATLIGGPARAAYRKDPAVQQSGDWVSTFTTLLSAACTPAGSEPGSEGARDHFCANPLRATSRDPPLALTWFFEHAWLLISPLASVSMPRL